MRESLEILLGRGYDVVIRDELSKLKREQRILLGEHCAILHRTDHNLGRSTDECKYEDDKTYIIFCPSEIALVCGEDFGSFRNAGSKYTLITINHFVDMLLKFDFNTIQLLYTNSIIYSSDEFEKIQNEFKRVLTITYRKECRVVFSKMAFSVYDQLQYKLWHRKSNDEHQLNNTAFLDYIACKAAKNLYNPCCHNPFENVFNIDEYSTILSELERAENSSETDIASLKTLIPTLDNDERVMNKELTYSLKLLKARLLRDIIRSVIER